jgi:hypothetical protein
MPEFVPIVKRLHTAASCRGAFPQLAQDPAMDMPLFHAFKTAVVLPPADAGYEKERFLHSIRDAARLRRVRKAVALVRDEYEPLYDLEKDWFETLLKLKKPRRDPSRQRGASIELPTLSGGAIVVIIIALRVLFAVLRSMN